MFFERQTKSNHKINKKFAKLFKVKVKKSKKKDQLKQNTWKDDLYGTIWTRQIVILLF